MKITHKHVWIIRNLMGKPARPVQLNVQQWSQPNASMDTLSVKLSQQPYDDSELWMKVQLWILISNGSTLKRSSKYYGELLVKFTVIKMIQCIIILYGMQAKIHGPLLHLHCTEDSVVFLFNENGDIGIRCSKIFHLHSFVSFEIDLQCMLMFSQY